MRKFASVASVIALAAAAPAVAADLAVKAPPLAAPVPFSWTGCHIGGNLGAVISQDTTTNVLGESRSFGSTGFAGGGQIGCDYQFAPNWVVGAEGRADWTSLTNTHAASVRNLVTGVVTPSQFALSNDFLASATARLGYSFAGSWLVFARGGAAWTHEKVDDAFVSFLRGIPVDPSATRNRAGWTVGTGVDWAFAPHWSASLEYNYYDFGKGGTTLVNAANNEFVTINNLKDTIHAVTAGVDYHF
jgi:outer membrane immunogenic protein